MADRLSVAPRTIQGVVERAILRAFETHLSASSARLATVTGYGPNSCGNALRRLRRKGFVSAAPAPNPRCSHALVYYLTPAQRAWLDGAYLPESVRPRWAVNLAGPRCCSGRVRDHHAASLP